MRFRLELNLGRRTAAFGGSHNGKLVGKRARRHSKGPQSHFRKLVGRGTVGHGS